MIDLHVPILHGLDDGPGTLSESLEMVRMAYDDGIRPLVATPHTLDCHAGGEVEARKLVVDYPQSILEDQKINFNPQVK
jgi:protein-tyrosine phosphatase